MRLSGAEPQASQDSDLNRTGVKPINRVPECRSFHRDRRGAPAAGRGGNGERTEEGLARDDVSRIRS